MHTLSTFGTASAFVALIALPASATVTKTWVSSTGTDSGTCQLVAPCKTFQFAHDQTSPGGEIDVKDTGSYGGLTITKAISIVSGDGALAAVGAMQGQSAITVNAGSSDVVTLQGLVIDGHGLGDYGINVVNGGGLTVENCKVRNFVFYGISLGNTYFNITDTELSGVGNSAIHIYSNSSTNGLIAKVNIQNNYTGIFVAGGANVSFISSIISGNGTGIQAYTNGNILIGQSTVAGNTYFGVTNSTGAGTINSYGDNYINANGTDIAGISSVAKR